jgi:hypothetical protein
MPDIQVKAPVAHDYKEPGEFINAWRRFTLGKEIPPPTADAVVKFRDFAKLIHDTAAAFMHTRTENQYRYFWSHFPARVTFAELMDPAYIEQRNVGPATIGEFISNKLEEHIRAQVMPAMHRLCRKVCSFRKLHVHLTTPFDYTIQHSPELFSRLDFGEPCTFGLMCKLSFEFVPPRCQNRRSMTIGAPRDLVTWARQFPGGVYEALAWLAIDASRSYHQGRHRGNREYDYVVGSDPQFWVPNAGKVEARLLAPQLRPFVRTNP